MAAKETPFHIGQLWRDQDGVVWRLVAAQDGWIYVKRHGYPRSATIQTHASWLHEWTPLDDTDASVVAL